MKPKKRKTTNPPLDLEREIEIGRAAILECDNCGDMLIEAFEMDIRADKMRSRIAEQADEKGWRVCNGGKSIYCPDCAGEENRP